ncbi:MAG: zinc ribbon domain-containing protein [Actinomycetes bacterium]
MSWLAAFSLQSRWLAGLVGCSGAREPCRAPKKDPVGDAAWTDLGRQLSYKAAWLDGELMRCDRWFPSTRTGRRCGKVKRQMRLAERTFHCDGCGLERRPSSHAAC